MVDWWGGSLTLTAAAVEKAKKEAKLLGVPIGLDRKCEKVPQKFHDFRHPHEGALPIAENKLTGRKTSIENM